MLTENQLFANRYRLVKRLGQGAFSEVWKAEDTKAGNLTVALKVYAPDKGLDEDGAKVFSDEFAIVFNVHHSNLLTPNYFDEENNSPYLVLPFCEQGSALKLVGKMGERQVAQFLHDVAAALAYLHGKGIVHQDIKPDNVLMDSEGTFLVTDFGISTRIRSTLRRSVGDKKSAGTMAYMGPERFSKNPDPIKASDIWSLGSTVFELMKGDVPFGEDGGLVQKIGAETPDIPGAFSPELKQLVEHCLAPNTWDRPMAAQLRDICDHYLRTGVWDLSSLNKSGTQEPEKPRKVAGRPTERKVFSKNPEESTGQTKEDPAKIQRVKPKMNTTKTKSDSPLPDSTTVKPKRTALWVGLGLGLAVVVIVIVLLLKPKPEPDDPDTLAYQACQTVDDYRAYMRNYGQKAAHFTDAKKMVDEFVVDSIAMARQVGKGVQAGTQADVVKQETETKPESVALTGTANGHDWVDLGLPSGTLWATCNVGASSPEGYGNYYAWGETATKDTYDRITYKYANGEYDKLTKYCNKSDYGNNGFTDNLTELQRGDDPAAAWGTGWHTPSKGQWDELLSNTTHKWTTRNGVTGRLFTSKKNGQALFLPAAGFRHGSENDFAGFKGDYWSRSLYAGSPDVAWSLSVSSDGYYKGNFYRGNGLSVRPVRGK